MTAYPPLCSYGVASVKPGQSVILNDKSSYDLISSSFTLSFYIRLHSSTSSNQMLMQLQKGSLTLNMDGTEISALIQSWQTVSSGVSLELKKWYCITLTLDTGSKQAALFVDGSPFGTTDPGKGFTPVSFTDYYPNSNGSYAYLGDSVHADFMSVCFFNDVLNPTEIIQNNYERPPKDKKRDYYDFSSLPVGGYTLKDGAQLNMKSPITKFSNGLAVPVTTDEGVNPGGDMSQPFSIQAWVRTLQPARTGKAYSHAIIYANGARNRNQGFAFGIQYADDLSHFVMCVNLPGREDPILDTTQLKTNQWNNMTVTWDGQEISFYLDGSLKSSQTIGGLSGLLKTPNLAIAGTPLGMEDEGYGYFFMGYLQSLGVWNRVLDATEIKNSEAPPPSIQEGLTAFYDMTTQDIVNNVTGCHYGRLGQVSTHEYSYDKNPQVPNRDNLTVGEEDAPDYINLTKLQAIDQHLDSHQIDLDEPLKSSALSDRHLDKFQREIDRALTGVPDHLKAGMSTRLNRNLRLALAQRDQADGPVPGSVTNHRDGEEMVWMMHCLDGPVEIHREAADALTPCRQWGLSAFITAVSIFMSVFGIKFSGSTLAKQLRKIMLKRNNAFNRALLKVENGDVSAEFVLDVIFFMVTDGTFKTVVTESIRNVSWWELSLTVVSIVAKVGGMFATSGWYLAFILAEVMLNITSLMMVVEEGARLGCLTSRVEDKTCVGCGG